MRTIATLTGTVVATAVVLSLSAPARAASCVPTTSAPLNLNGVVVGTTFGGAGAPPPACAGDAGWAGVPANQFFTTGGAADSLVSDLFMVGQAAGANLDNLWIGIHVENDDTFDANDTVALYFDVNGNGTFDAADFALTFEAGPISPVVDNSDGATLNEKCQQNINGTPLIWHFSGGVWGSPTAAPAGAVSLQTSWDYDKVTDPETNIWEVEMKIAPSLLSPAVTIPVGSNMRVGAKLFLFRVGDAGLQVVTIPSMLATGMDPNNETPNDGNITTLPASAQVGVGSCPFDVDVQSISARSAFNADASKSFQPGSFTRFTSAISGTLTDDNTNRFSATVRFRNPSNPADTTAVAPNTGTATFHALPWSGGFLGDITTGAPSVTFNALGQIRTMDVYWPRTEADYSTVVPGSGGMTARQLFNTAAAAAGGHVCFKVDASGFAIDSNAANNSMQQNLAFVTASTIKEQFLIQAPARQDVGPKVPHASSWVTSGPTTQFLLTTRWENVPDSLLAAPGQTLPPNTYNNQQRRAWTYSFPTAKQIGLNDMGKGVFSISLKPGEQRAIDVELTGGTMPATTHVVHVSPRAGGANIVAGDGDKSVDITVQPAMTLSVVATGSVQVSKETRANGPDGFIDASKTATGAPAVNDQRRFLISNKSAYVGFEHVGALIGSFDGFATAFVIGGASSFEVPDGATVLSLAVNDEAGKYADNLNTGFDVTVALGPPSHLPTRMVTQGNPNNGAPAVVAPGTGLPIFNIDVLAFDPVKKRVEPNGYVAYVVYASHPDDQGTGGTGGGGMGTNQGCGACNAQRSSNLALLLVGGVGLTVGWRRRRRAKRE